MTNCIFPKENIFFRKSCLFFLKQIDKSWYGTVVGQKNHQKCPEGPGLKEVKVRWKKEKGRSFFWSVLPLTQQKSSPLLSSSKRFILATCLRNSTPLYFFGKFLLSTLSFIQKALLQKNIQHCFYHDCNIVKNFQNRNKDTGTSIWNGEIWQTGPTISKFDLFQKSDSVSLLKKADFLEPRIAIKQMKTRLAENGAKWRGN